MKPITLVSILLIISMPMFGQGKLYLEKDKQQIRICDNAWVGIKTVADSFDRNAYWKLDSVENSHLVISKFTYERIEPMELKPYYDSGWEDARKNDYEPENTVRKRVESSTINYQDIREISFARNENESTCMACVVFPLGVVLSPVIAIDNHGKFQMSTFVPVFAISAGISYLLYLDGMHRRVKSYHIGEWKIVLR